MHVPIGPMSSICSKCGGEARGKFLCENCLRPYQRAGEKFEPMFAVRRAREIRRAEERELVKQDTIAARKRFGSTKKK